MFAFYFIFSFQKKIILKEVKKKKNNRRLAIGRELSHIYLRYRVRTAKFKTQHDREKSAEENMSASTFLTTSLQTVRM